VLKVGTRPTAGTRPTGRPRGAHRAPVHPAWGSGAIVFAASLWGTIGLARSFLPGSAPVVAVAAARTLAGGGLLLVCCCRPAEVAALISHAATRYRLVVAGVAMAAYQGLYFAAMGLAGGATGAVVTLCAVPVFGGALEAVNRRRQPGGRWALSTALTATGCLVLAEPSVSGRPVAQGVLLAVIAGATYAVFTAASSGAVSGGVRSSTVMAVALGLAGVLLSPVLAVSRLDWLATARGAAVVGYLAIVVTMCAYLAFGQGLRQVPVSRVGGLVLAEPIVAAALGILVLRESCSVRRAVGLALTAAALVVISLADRVPDRDRRADGRSDGLGGRKACRLSG
jgi:DME family drug/metabolite transporter